MRIFPRLSLVDAKPIAEKMCREGIESLTSRAAFSHVRGFFPASGGQRINESELEDFREGVLKEATRSGFPQALCPTASFDRSMAEFLYEEVPIHPGEAARGDVWSFLTCVVLPDVARWRFQDTTHTRRFIGGHTRNVFQRLWWRAWTLHDGLNGGDPYHLLEGLNEDALVQIMERPSIRSNRELSRALAMHFLDEDLFSVPALRERQFRDCIKKVRQVLPIIDITTRGPETVIDRAWLIFASVIESSSGGAQVRGDR